MQGEIYFFIIFLATIIITRLFLYLRPIPAPTINGFRMHHYMYGLILIILSFFLSNATGYAIGLGLFIDQVPYLVTHSRTHGEKEFNKNTYWLKKHLIGLVLLIIVVFIFKRYILFF